VVFFEYQNNLPLVSFELHRFFPTDWQFRCITLRIWGDFIAVLYLLNLPQLSNTAAEVAEPTLGCQEL
jgi:hypothetical protein